MSSPLDEHIRIAAGALARGLIDARAFVEALSVASDGASLEQVWVVGGRLSADQLALLRSGGALEPTVAVSGDTVPQPKAPPPGLGADVNLAALNAWLAKASVLGFGHVHDPGPATQASRHEIAPREAQPSQRAATHVMRVTIPPPPGAPAGSSASPAAPAPPAPTDLATDFAPKTEIASAAARAAAASAALSDPPTASNAAIVIPPSAAATDAEIQPAADSDAATGVKERERRATNRAPGAPPPAPTAAPAARAPRVRYERRELLGLGGLGQVTACYDTVLGRRVAVKVARSDQDPTAEQILEREARIIAQLEHPNIMPAYDAGNQPGAGPYYVMRLVDQPSLDKVLERIARGDEKARDEYGLKRLLRYFVQICNAVDYAHSRGVIHCDLKPANILLGEFGEVLVVDWGLAWSRRYPDGPRGGTPGFMAPEQVDRGRRDFDARTDVFALGVILYMLLCLRPPFAAPHGAEVTTQTPAERYRPAKRPSEHAPHAGIPREVEDVAMRAIALDPADRHESARAIAQAIDEWLEGRREAERRRAAADESTAQGDELAERVLELEAELREHAAQLAAVRAETPAWAAPADKQGLWDLEDLRAVTDALRVRTLGAAVGAYEQALEQLPEHAGARRGLARMYRLEVARAQAERHEHDRLWFQTLAQRYDDGGDEAGGDGRLAIEVAPGDCAITLHALADDQRRLIPREAGVLDGRPRMMRMVPSGRYLIECRAHGRTACWPVVVIAGADANVAIDPELLAALGDDEALVPAGAVPLGEALELADARPPAVVDVATFVARRLPVTFAEYLEHVDAAGAEPPRDDTGAPLWTKASGAWRALALELEPRMPAFGITYAAATAYAAWRAARDGVPWRLPTGDEWEKAARGADGRLYPWGDAFDAAFCKMRDSRPGAARPEPVGAFALDVSPYGVRDLGGGIAEWTAAEAGGAIYSRGGAWCDPRIDCRATTRRLYRAGEHALRVGLRLVRTVT